MQDSFHHTVSHSLDRAYGTQITDTSYYTNELTMGATVPPSWCQCHVCTSQIHVLSYDAPAPVLLPPVEYKSRYNWRELLPHPRCNIVRNEGTWSWK